MRKVNNTRKIKTKILDYYRFLCYNQYVLKHIQYLFGEYIIKVR